MICLKLCLSFSRSTSSSNVHAQLMTQSMYVPSSGGQSGGGGGGGHQRRSSEREILGEPNNRRSTSTQGLDRTGAEGKINRNTSDRRSHVLDKSTDGWGGKNTLLRLREFRMGFCWCCYFSWKNESRMLLYVLFSNDILSPVMKI